MIQLSVRERLRPAIQIASTCTLMLLSVQSIGCRLPKRERLPGLPEQPESLASAQAEGSTQQSTSTQQSKSTQALVSGSKLPAAAESPAALANPTKALAGPGRSVAQASLTENERTTLEQTKVETLIPDAMEWTPNREAASVEDGADAMVDAGDKAGSQTVASTDAASIVKLQVSGVDPKGGPVRVALFTSKDAFPDQSKAIRTAEFSSASETLHREISDVPAEPIAIAVYQDLNGDGKLNRSSFGIPIEPYGFSNNARGRMGPPSFQDARVEASRNSRVVPISLTKIAF